MAQMTSHFDQRSGRHPTAGAMAAVGVTAMCWVVQGLQAWLGSPSDCSSGSAFPVITIAAAVATALSAWGFVGMLRPNGLSASQSQRLFWWASALTWLIVAVGVGLFLRWGGCDLDAV